MDVRENKEQGKRVQANSFKAKQPDGPRRPQEITKTMSWVEVRHQMERNVLNLSKTYLKTPEKFPASEPFLPPSSLSLSGFVLCSRKIHPSPFLQISSFFSFSVFLNKPAVYLSSAAPRAAHFSPLSARANLPSAA